MAAASGSKAIAPSPFESKEEGPAEAKIRRRCFQSQSVDLQVDEVNLVMTSVGLPVWRGRIGKAGR